MLTTLARAFAVRSTGLANHSGPSQAGAKETLGGIPLLEARDLNHAISLMSKHPGVRRGPSRSGLLMKQSTALSPSEVRRSLKKHDRTRGQGSLRRESWRKLSTDAHRALETKGNHAMRAGSMTRNL